MTSDQAHVSSCLQHYYGQKLKDLARHDLRRQLAEAELSLAELEAEKRALLDGDLPAAELRRLQACLEQDEPHLRARLAAIQSLLESAG